MSCEKSVNCCPVGCFAVTPVDDCKKVPCGVSVCKNPCNHVPSCCDYGFNSNCKKVACCVKPCTKSYHCIPSGCDYGCKDDCKKVACCVCDDHKSVIFVLYKIFRIIVFLFQHKLLYFFLKKSIPRVFIFNVIFLLQKVNYVMFAPGQQGRSRVTGLAVWVVGFSLLQRARTWHTVSSFLSCVTGW